MLWLHKIWLLCTGNSDGGVEYFDLPNVSDVINILTFCKFLNFTV